jgi:SAM-dependent methyltransferase/GNAT superfamily N-acetyltransferase
VTWPCTMTNVCRRAIEILQRDGVRALWFAVLGRTLYRRLVLLERRLDADIPEVGPRVPVVIGLLEPAEAAEYARFHWPLDVAEVERRLAAGHWCFVARHAGAIVHAGWAVAERGWIDYLGCPAPLRAREVYQTDSFTAPAYRGLDLAGARVAMMARWLRARGYRRLLAAVLPENRAAFRPLEKVGYRRIGWIGVVRLGRWRKTVGAFPGAAHDSTPPRADGELPAYWDGVLNEFQDAAPLTPWRAYMQHVYSQLVAAWMPAPAPALKTDLFEEAVTPYHVLGELGPGSIGIDCSPGIVQQARKRLGNQYHVVVGDLRHIPLRTGCVGRILAGSSLDHFHDKRDITVALAELVRVLKPGGTLVVTFDNPHNPAVWVRNRLPFSWLRRVGLVPYYVGATYGRAEAERILNGLGLQVTTTTVVAHAPRALAIWLAMLAERLGRPGFCQFVLRLLDRCELMESLPTRFRTGYYLAFRAQKGITTT